MRIRSGVLASLVCLAFVSAACADAADDQASSDQALTKGWAPTTATCAQVAEYLEGPGASEYATPPASGPVVIELDVKGNDLIADPPKAAVKKGQGLQWVSNDLDVWGVRFLETNPAGKAPGLIKGMAKGTPAPAADVAAVTADCGRYYYVAAAIHPKTGEIMILDPPIMVRN